MSESYVFKNKIEARRETIIKPYQSLMHSRLPNKRQYWTLCALCATERGELLPNCELDQMMQAGVVKSMNQFHGVDRSAPVIRRNETAIPGSNWHYGNFYSVLVEAVANGTFKPGVINYDTLVFVKKGCAGLVRILNLVADYSDVMVVGNFILRCRCLQNGQVSDVVEALNAQPSLSVILNKGWKLDQDVCKAYVYSGASHRQDTKMVSVVFYKNE